MKNKDYKRSVMVEHYSEYCIYGETGITLREYVEREAENDPAFFKWLFDDGDINDFGTNLPEDKKAEYQEWLEEL